MAYLCVGYPEEFPSTAMLETVGWRERTPLEQVVFEDRYGQYRLWGPS
jgi:5,6-dimethylbenzimidazole synthase